MVVEQTELHRGSHHKLGMAFLLFWLSSVAKAIQAVANGSKLGMLVLLPKVSPVGINRYLLSQ
jgi:hypothetical protein